MQLRSKEPLKYEWAIKAGRIPPRTFAKLLSLVQGEIGFIQAHYDTPEIRARLRANRYERTLKDENTLPFALQRKISAFLEKLWYSLSIEYLARNEIIRFWRVEKHNDAHVKRSGATVFIPLLLPRNEGVEFWHASNPEGVYTLEVWDIMVFDQNENHALNMEMKPNDEHMWYGLVLFLDKLPPKEN